MSDESPPLIGGTPPSEQDKALLKLWSELEKGQLDLLDQSNKRIIEMVTGLQALFLAVAALGKDFPPPYLQGWASLLAVLVIGFLLMALLAAVLGLQPRDYAQYEHNLTEMRRELQRMVHYKKKWYRNAIWLFFAGSLLLAGLLVMIIV